MPELQHSAAKAVTLLRASGRLPGSAILLHAQVSAMVRYRARRQCRHLIRRADTLAFSNTGKLRAFMANSGLKFEDVFVANERQGLIAVIADIHLRGGDAVCLDPDSNGHGGECVFLADLILVE